MIFGLYNAFSYSPSPFLCYRSRDPVVLARSLWGVMSCVVSAWVCLEGDAGGPFIMDRALTGTQQMEPLDGNLNNLET